LPLGLCWFGPGDSCFCSSVAIGFNESYMMPSIHFFSRQCPTCTTPPIICGVGWEPMFLYMHCTATVTCRSVCRGDKRDKAARHFIMMTSLSDRFRAPLLRLGLEPDTGPLGQNVVRRRGFRWVSVTCQRGHAWHPHIQGLLRSTKMFGNHLYSPADVQVHVSVSAKVT